MQFALKNWFHHIHFPVRRDSVLRTKSFLYKENFWRLLALIAILAVLGLLFYWSSTNNTPVVPDSYTF